MLTFARPVVLAVALAAGSVSLLADSVDFLEDTAINLLLFIALGWPLARLVVLLRRFRQRSANRLLTSRSERC